jgi:hypothetical protein
MPTPQRLPIVNADDAVWGDILRQYLMKEHYNDDTDNSVNGGHQKITVRAGTATAGTAPLKFTSGTLMSTPEEGAMEFNNNFLYFTIASGTVRKKVALYDDTSGATGDIYYRDAAGIITRLAVGGSGQILGTASGLPAWKDTNTDATNTRTGSYAVVKGTDVVILADASGGNVTVTLPTAASSTGYRFDIKRIDNSGNTCTIARSSTDTIDGQTSYDLPVQYTSVTVISNGSGWYIL